ncbi:MAG TPA: SGNH/GDSL hydrolase family protein [Burkholderiales bacterium]|nr:SGNH/GDSL hydrolase family protein [Burkholderiales bacterium]
MNRRHFLFVALWSGLAAGLPAWLPAAWAAGDDWNATWTASPHEVWAPDFLAPVKVPRNLWGQTVRQVAQVSIGGRRVRVVLSNEFGPWPLKIGAAHIGLSAKGSAIVPGSDRMLTFGGRPSIVIPPGAPVLSDPVDLSVAPLASVVVSFFVPDVTPVSTFHWDACQTTYVVAGNKVSEVDFKADSTFTARILLSEVLVDAPADARAIVAFGDSITDGNNSTVDTNRRWPDVLARRLVETGGPPVAVLNEGISGARILTDRMGVNALARFDRDVVQHRHADTVILMMGINDIGWPDSILDPNAPAPSAEDVIAGYQQLIARAHVHNMRIIGATLTPFEDTFKGSPLSGYYSAAKEQKRQALNKWIRESGAFDGVIDFDAVVRDPSRPTFIQAAYDSGDHLHPNDAGYKAMAESIDLRLLRGQP